MVAIAQNVKKRTTGRTRKSRKSRKNTLGKPQGVILDRVKAAGPEKFGIVAVDCAKVRSKFLLADFYGEVLIPPTELPHSEHALQQAIRQLKDAAQKHGLNDLIVAVEMTGVYHKIPMNAFRRAGLETRLVHPFASSFYSCPENGDVKTDDRDLAGIFRATVNGFGLIEKNWPPEYQRLQVLVRHRRDLTTKRSKVQCQIRHHLHLALPGFTALFPIEDFWTQQTPVPLLKAILIRGGTVEVVRQAGHSGVTSWLREAKVRIHEPAVARVLKWSEDAVAADESASVRIPVLRSLLDDWQRKTQEINECERDMIRDLVRTPYVLLMSYPGISVVTAAGLAGEAGPIENYASPKALSGRAGLFPSRYQSDEVDRTGTLTRFRNARLRAALMLMASNLLACNHWWKARAFQWEQQGHKDPADQRVRVANRMTRTIYQMVAGRHTCKHSSQREPAYVMDKLMNYCRERLVPPNIIVSYLRLASDQMRLSDRKREGENLKPVALRIQQSRKSEPQLLGNLLVALLAQVDIASNNETVKNPT